MISTVVVTKGDWKTIKQREDRKRNWGKLTAAGTSAATIGTGVYGLTHQMPGEAVDRSVYRRAKAQGKKFPFVRANAATPKGKLRLAGLGLGAAGVGAIGAGMGGRMYEQHKINQRRRANDARNSARTALHNKLRNEGINRDGHIFMERTGPDGEIMQTHSGYKHGSGGKLVKVGKAAPLTQSQRDQKALQRVESKKRQSDFGLANNAFGAAAGAYGTKAVWNQQRDAANPVKAAQRAAAGEARALERRVKVARIAGKHPTAARRLNKVIPRIPRKVAVPLAMGTAVGSQLVNAGMDAQSGAYFAGESRNLRKKEKRVEARIERHGGVVKSYEQLYDVVIVSKAKDKKDGRGKHLEDEKHRGLGRKTVGEVEHGKAKEKFRQPLVQIDTTVAHRLKSLCKADDLVTVSKRKRRFDPEGDRQRRLGVYQGAGTAGALGLGGGAGLTGYQAWKQTTPAQRTVLRAAGKKAILPAALLAGAAGSTGLGVAAHRQANSARNQRWT